MTIEQEIKLGILDGINVSLILPVTISNGSTYYYLDKNNSGSGEINTASNIGVGGVLATTAIY